MIRKTLVAALAAVLAVGGVAACESRADKCVREGGTVTSEREYDKKHKRTVTEYECIDAQGTEVDEW